MRESPYEALNKVKATTAEEMAKEIEIDFIAEKRELYFEDPLGNPIANPDHVAVVRKDTDDYLGTVGSNYGLVQYIEMLRFTEELAQAGDAEYVCGGPIGKGEQAFVVMRTDSKVVLGPNDDLGCYFYAMTSHNRTTNLSVVPTPYRKSTGTVLMPVSKGDKLRFRHSKHVQNHITKAKKSYSFIENYFERFQKSFNLLTQVHLKDPDIELYLETILPLEGKEKTTRTENIRERIKEIFKTDATLQFPSCKGTMAGLYLATCYHADTEHLVKESKRMDRESAQILSSLDGSAARRKAEALGTALMIQKKFASRSKLR